jgi:hypothetical protein
MFTERPFFRTLQIMAASLLALFADSASQFATCMGHIGKVDVIYVYIYICTDLQASWVAIKIFIIFNG